MWERVYRTGQPQAAREWRVMVDRTRTGVLEEGVVDFVVAPHHDADGAVIGCNGYAVDVTDQVRRRQAEQERTQAAQQRYEQAHDIIDALQRELLPTGVPVVPGIEIAASYLLADADTAAGGDWFDATPLPDGRVALVVGDVVGHGVAASAVMGKLQVLVSELLAETGSVGLALEAADRLAQRTRGARAATVCVVVVDPDTGTVEYVTAGHPPPLGRVS